MPTREELLRSYGRHPFNEPSEFVKDFPNVAEMVALGVTIGVRQLIRVVSASDPDPKDVIAAVKLLAILDGKDFEDEVPAGRTTTAAGDTELLEAVARTRKATG